MPEKKSQKSKVKSKKTEILPKSDTKLKTKVLKGPQKLKTVKVVKEKVKKTITKTVRKPNPDLKSSIIEGILDKKGEEIVVIDFNKINNSFCDYFIVCQGSSDRQVESIADGIEERVRKQIGIKPSHKEGYENAQWILLDYLDIIVHIFQPETRQFYQIEALWGDAEQLTISN